MAMTRKQRAAARRVQDLLRAAAATAAQVALLWVFARAGHALVGLLHLPLPGNVAGMLLTFAALTSGALPLRWVEQGAGLLVRNLPLFFVPLAAGFVSQGPLLAAHGVAIVATLVASAFVGFAATGRAAQLVSGLQAKAAVVIGSRHVETRLDRR